MADFPDNNPPKKGTASVFPDGAIKASLGQDRVEAFLTPEKFRERFFFGFPLISPITKERLTTEMLQDFIVRGANKVEMDAKLDVFPVVRREKLPFIPADYTQYMYMEIARKPIQKVLSLQITSASYNINGGMPVSDPNNVDPNGAQIYPSGSNVYTIPNDWIEMTNARRGRLNVIPLTSAFLGINPTSTASQPGGSAVYILSGLLGWLPAYWQIEFVTGFCSDTGNIPGILNEAIGTAAAILLISTLLPLFRITSQSLSLDGMGQSNSDALYQILLQRYNLLLIEYDKLTEKLKAYTGSKLFSTAI